MTHGTEPQEMCLGKALINPNSLEISQGGTLWHMEFVNRGQSDV